MANTWSKEEDEALTRLMIEERCSCGVAASRLARLFPTRKSSDQPFTRNSVIGRVHRLGLSGRIPTKQKPSSIGGGHKGASPRAKPSVPQVKLERKRPDPAAPKAKSTHQPVSNRTVERVDGTCQWINGDVRAEHHRCGKPATATSNWCEHHLKLAYQPYVGRKDNPAPMPGSNMRRWQ